MTSDMQSNIKIKSRYQSLFDSNSQTLVNTVNCVGVMGKGIAKEFKARYPEMFKEYNTICNNNELKVGKPYVWKSKSKKWVLNFPTKCHYKDGSKIEWIEDGLKYFKDHYKEWGITSIAFPALGCSNGGLDWNVVLPIMKKYLGDIKDIEIEIYQPYIPNDNTAQSKSNVFVNNKNRKKNTATQLDDTRFVYPRL